MTHTYEEQIKYAKEIILEKAQYTASDAEYKALQEYLKHLNEHAFMDDLLQDINEYYDDLMRECIYDHI